MIRAPFRLNGSGDEESVKESGMENVIKSRMESFTGAIVSHNL